MLMLFPGERPVYPEAPSGGLSARVALREGETWLTATTRIAAPDGRSYAGMARVRRSELNPPLIAERLRQRAVKQSFTAPPSVCRGKSPSGAP